MYIHIQYQRLRYGARMLLVPLPSSCDPCSAPSRVPGLQEIAYG